MKNGLSPRASDDHCTKTAFFSSKNTVLGLTFSHFFFFFIENIARFYSFNNSSIVCWKIFIQRMYSFKTIPIYSFKENIHSSEKWIIAQGYATSVFTSSGAQFSVKTDVAPSINCCCRPQNCSSESEIQQMALQFWNGR